MGFRLGFECPTLNPYQKEDGMPWFNGGFSSDMKGTIPSLIAFPCVAGHMIIRDGLFDVCF